MRNIFYVVAILIVAALVFVMKENEDIAQARVDILCLGSKAPLVNPANQKKLDLLWSEVISYLDNYRRTLEAQHKKCLTRTASTLSYQGDKSKPKECLDRYYDVILMVNQIKQIVSNKDAAKKCFDPTMSEVEPLSFKGMTPHENMKSFSSVARWLDRVSFKTRYNQDTPVHRNLAGFADNFLENLKDAETSSQWYEDPTIDNYPHLWASAPWIPMYVDKEDAGPASFRGGYAYAEILGPWGMLRIDEIGGIKFQAEVGITNQKGGSFYPPHYHYAGELYIALSKSTCQKKLDRYLLIPKTTEDEDWADNFEAIRKLSSSLIYIKRNFIHSFEVTNCQSDPNRSLVTAWSRTAVRDDLDQTTSICKAKNGTIAEKFTPEMKYNCH